MIDKEHELAELLLPAGILEHFDYVGYTRERKSETSYDELTITLEEKNILPKLPAEHKDKQVRQKGFKEIKIDDFPIRGKKVKLVLRRRVWQIEGTKELYKKDLDITYAGTKLEKDFAFFFKD